MSTVILSQPTGFQWSRSSAISATLAVHAMAALLMLAPPALRQLQPRIAPASVPITIKPVEIPPKPIPVLDVKKFVKPQPVTPILQKTVTPPKPEVVTDSANPMSFPVVETPITVPAGPDIAPVETAPTALGYQSVKNVPYPREAMRRREQGTVMLRVLVGADGTPQQIDIEKSSGSLILDRAARDAVMKWRFTPGSRNGQPFAAVGLVPIAFRLNEL